MIEITRKYICDICNWSEVTPTISFAPNADYKIPVERPYAFHMVGHLHVCGKCHDMAKEPLMQLARARKALCS